jgi:hypothetical protein
MEAFTVNLKAALPTADSSMVLSPIAAIAGILPGRDVRAPEPNQVTALVGGPRISEHGRQHSLLNVPN